jgi:hypothetical protein
MTLSGPGAMTKLTVAEASKRGYATGLSILQAVQKDWLQAEKSDDGQLLVDTGELERLFGRPTTGNSGGFETPAPALPATNGENAPATRALPPDDIGDFDAIEDADDTDDAYADAVDDDVYPNEYAPADDAAPNEADTADNAALRAEIAELRGALAAERRRTAALTDVLATRVLGPEAESRIATPVQTGSDDRSPGPDSGGDGGTIAPQPAADTGDSAKSDDAQPVAEAEPEVDTGAELAETPEIGQALEPEQPAVSQTDDTTDLEPPIDDIAVPALAANPAERQFAPPLARARFNAEKAEPDRALFWQVWVLVSLVWIVLIGAILWYIGGLGDDLWIVAEWIRGERETNSPAFAEAASASLRAARDIFAPPLALLVLMLLGRKAFRAVRSR